MPWPADPPQGAVDPDSRTGDGYVPSRGGMIGHMAAPQPPAGRFGCLGMVVGTVVLAAIVVLVIFAGIFVLGLVAALVVVGLVVVAVDRVMLALSPKRRARRANQSRAFVWRYGAAQAGDVIDATAIEATEGPNDRADDDPDPDQLNQE
jgi:hypothetical protein